MSFAQVESLQHEIHAHYRALRAIRMRKALEGSALWAEIGGEVRRVLDGVERGDRAPGPVPAARGRGLRAVAWNIQRGARLDDLRRAVVAPPFADADLSCSARWTSAWGARATATSRASWPRPSA